MHVSTIELLCFLQHLWIVQCISVGLPSLWALERPERGQPFVFFVVPVFTVFKDNLVTYFFKRFAYFILCVGVCLHVCMCTNAFKEGKGIRYPRTGAAVLYKLPVWFRAASDLNGWASPTVLICNFETKTLFDTLWASKQGHNNLAKSEKSIFNSTLKRVNGHFSASTKKPNLYLKM